MKIMENLIRTLKKLDFHELDQILDQRDGESFSQAWCELHELVSTSSASFDAKEIFIKLSGITNAHEICSYIVEDLELIIKAEDLSVEPKFLNYLKKSYEQGTVPCTWSILNRI
ncbi:MAG: hypothetical protein AB8B80_03735 [Marinicellaceae bacterium]